MTISVLDKEKDAILISESKSGEPKWWSSCDTSRKAAIESFGKTGYPTTRWENWKYSSILPLLKKEFRRSGSNPNASASSPALNLENELFVHVGKDNKISGHSTSGVTISNFSQLNADQLPTFSAQYGRNLKFEQHPFLAINTFQTEEGIFTQVGKNEQITTPIHFQHDLSGAKENELILLRHLITVGDNAEACIIFSYSTAAEKETLLNSVVEINCGRNAKLDIVFLQNDNTGNNSINYCHANQGTDSRCTAHTLTTEGGFIRNDLHFIHEGQGIESNMYGVYLPSKGMLVDNHTYVDHAKPNCQSNEHYKGLILDGGKAVFNGIIMVRPDAQKTNAFQSNNNILLSPNAVVNTKPQLEIFADDVKCSHGATTGRMNPEAMFYLKARGISEPTAKKLLSLAFCEEILEKLPADEIRTFISNKVEEKLNNA